MLVSDSPIGATPPAQLPTPAEVMSRARGENFPVASRLLPRGVRSHLLAVYGFARLLDELGDAVPGDRPQALAWIERELDRAYSGCAEHPLMVRLQSTLRECALPREPFARLIEANRVDQRLCRYHTWEQLRGYCELSANPVGEIVLHIFAVATSARIARSDAICTALQLAEHCQDVVEDAAAGRVYLPLEDLKRLGCDPEDLARDRRSGAPGGHDSRGEDPLCAVIAFQVARARALLREGEPLIDELRGRERLAVAAFVAGGRSALEAIEHAGFDVRAGPPRAPRRRLVKALVTVLVDRRRDR